MRRRKPDRRKLPTSVPMEWVDGLRGGPRRTLTRWGLHALIVLVFVSVPYLRGRWRAQATQDKYAQVDTCVLGGGEDPSGEFATRFLRV